MKARPKNPLLAALLSRLSSDECPGDDVLARVMAQAARHQARWRDEMLAARERRPRRDVVIDDVIRPGPRISFEEFCRLMTYPDKFAAIVRAREVAP